MIHVTISKDIYYHICTRDNVLSFKNLEHISNILRCALYVFFSFYQLNFLFHNSHHLHYQFLHNLCIFNEEYTQYFNLFIIY